MRGFGTGGVVGVVTFGAELQWWMAEPWLPGEGVMGLGVSASSATLWSTSLHHDTGRKGQKKNRRKEEREGLGIIQNSQRRPNVRLHHYSSPQ